MCNNSLYNFIHIINIHMYLRFNNYFEEFGKRLRQMYYSRKLKRKFSLLLSIKR